MPPPVIYVVVAFAVVGVGYALYQIFKSDDDDPNIPSASQQKQNNERRLVEPHEVNQSSSSDSSHEMIDLRQSATRNKLTTERALPPSAGLRNRRNNTSARNAEDVFLSTHGLMDAPSDRNIPIIPLAPEPNPWSSLQGTRQAAGPPSSPFDDRHNEITFGTAETTAGGMPIHSPTQSPFELGSESPSLSSISPRSDDISLVESHISSSAAPQPVTLVPEPIRSPFDDGTEPETSPSASVELYLLESQDSPWTGAPRIQLPTPSDSDVEVFSPTSPESRPAHEWTTISSSSYQHEQLSSPSPSTSNVQIPHALTPDVFAPPVSRTATDMSASFFTAQSPGSDFHSLPPTEPTSPFSEAFTLSGDDEMFSLPSRTDSEESLPAFAIPDEERHRRDGLMFVVGNAPAPHDLHEDDLDDRSSDTSGEGSSGDISDESWGEFSAPPTSPRH